MISSAIVPAIISDFIDNLIMDAGYLTSTALQSINSRLLRVRQFSRGKVNADIAKEMAKVLIVR